MRVILALFLFFVAAPAWAERFALVLGNGAYVHETPLGNAANDARDMAAKLHSLGFEVYEGIDLTREQTLGLVQKFSRALTFDDTALFYFAGHGMQIGSDNYILPVDARPGNELSLTESSIRLQTILRTLENAADTRIVILDACRNNPFLRDSATRSTATNRGLMKMEAGVGSFIAFATEPGNVAADGTGRNSPFTAALLRHISAPGADVHAVMRSVRGDVMSATNDSQVPWENSALLRQVFLGPADQVPTPQIQTPSARQPDPLQDYPFYVGGLDPNGDGFLALRQAATSNSAMLSKMTDNTPLQVLSQSGSWRQVRTPDGRLGWAHGRWIYCCRVGTNTAFRQTQQPPPAPPAPAYMTCDQLWHARNSIFAAHGYCFKSARGKAAFGHLACNPNLTAGNVPLSAAERAEVNRLKDLETRQGC